MTSRFITLDTGALIAIERRKRRGILLLDLAKQRLARLQVPVPVIVEWWRARSDARERILDAVSVEPLSIEVARAAGEALAKLKPRSREGSLAIDAIVVAFAASHGGIVYTTDVDDLERIAAEAAITSSATSTSSSRFNGAAALIAAEVVEMLCGEHPSGASTGPRR